MTLTPRFVGELPLAAASGMARIGDSLFVVADDENRLLELKGSDPLSRGHSRGLTPFLAGTQPKRAKLDIEALAAVPGSLVALGSGSTAARCRGFVWRTEADGPLGDATELDLAPLYRAIAIPDLNIEGAVYLEGALVLLQRGNGAAGVNAAVELEWRGTPEETLVPGAIRGGREYDLGTAGGVRLCFTDGVAVGRDLVFTAVAEAVESTYLDGPCVGAAVGVLGGELFPLEPALKVEGIETGAAAGEFLLAVDADDPGKRAQLVSVELSLPAASSSAARTRPR